ncbi:MAG: hypothetical protein FWG80_01495 [Alphaproteobacteria bacterium]|nr:hypothetical protein [Alphaproteobacteria bacterium]
MKKLLIFFVILFIAKGAYCYLIKDNEMVSSEERSEIDNSKYIKDGWTLCETADDCRYAYKPQCCGCNNGGDPHIGIINRKYIDEFRAQFDKETCVDETGLPYLCLMSFNCRETALACIDGKCAQLDKQPDVE